MPRKASKLASCFALCFAVVGCDTLAETLRCSGLVYVTRGRNTLSNAPVVNRVWYRANDPNGYLDLWPFLADMELHFEVSNQIAWYYPKGYSFEKAPYTYTPTNVGSVTIPDDWTDSDIKNVLQGAYNGFTLAQQAAITGAICGTTDHGDGSFDHWCYFTHKPVETEQNGGIIVYGPDGTPELGYPDANGYVPGYVFDGVGGTVPAYYHNVDGQIVTVSSLQDVSSSQLQYDSETGLYNFELPDYGPQLTAINDNLSSLANRPFVIDNIELSVPAPEVTVNVPAPEVTVNVPAPEVTVNVPAPEVTVNVPAPDVTVEAPVVNVDTSSIVDSLNSSASITDPVVSPLAVSSDEQHLLDEVSGWHDQIPLIGDAFGSGMDFLVGRIPSIGHDLEAIPPVSIAGFEFGIDFTDYAQPISWLRALCLLSLIVGFVHVIWSTVVQSLQI